MSSYPAVIARVFFLKVFFETKCLSQGLIALVSLSCDLLDCYMILYYVFVTGCVYDVLVVILSMDDVDLTDSAGDEAAMATHEQHTSHHR